jgi:GH35 family endo-1,4-beta-xylanase
MNTERRNFGFSYVCRSVRPGSVWLAFVIQLTCAAVMLVAAPAQAIIPAGQRLKDLTGPDLFIGSLIGPGNALPLTDNAPFKVNHREVLLRECNSATVTCYPTSVWKAPQQVDLSHFNALVNWLHEKNCKPIAHLLVGPMHYYPQWFVEGKYTPMQLEELLGESIRMVMTQNDNAKKVFLWNVVNEALHGERGNVYRPVHWNALGWEEDASGLEGKAKVLKRHPVWVRKSFELARKWTAGKLEYRDNNCEFPNSKQADGVYQLVSHLVKKSTPLDAIGFQMHLEIDREYDWPGFKQLVKQYQELGLQVNVTEVDVRGEIKNPADAQRQGRHYYDLIKACRESGVALIHFWGLRDGSLGPESKQALLFQESATYAPKPAYYEVQRALQETMGKP